MERVRACGGHEPVHRYKGGASRGAPAPPCPPHRGRSARPLRAGRPVAGGERALQRLPAPPLLRILIVPGARSVSGWPELEPMASDMPALARNRERLLASGRMAAEEDAAL